MWSPLWNSNNRLDPFCFIFFYWTLPSLVRLTMSCLNWLIYALIKTNLCSIWKKKYKMKYYVVLILTYTRIIINFWKICTAIFFIYCRYFIVFIHRSHLHLVWTSAYHHFKSPISDYLFYILVGRIPCHIIDQFSFSLILPFKSANLFSLLECFE